MQSTSKACPIFEAGEGGGIANTSVSRIGCFVGAILTFIFGEALGRKKCIYLGACLMFVGAALQASSFGVPQMLVGRIVW